MTKCLDGKSIGLNKIEYDSSINNRLAVGKMNLKINQSQEKIMLEVRKAARDAHIADSLKREKSEDQRTLSRLEKEYKLPAFNETDPDSWTIRLQTLSTVIANLVDNSDILQTENELKIRSEFIEKVAGISSKREKEKIENSDPESILNFSNLLARRIMKVDDDVEASTEDSKSNDK